MDREQILAKLRYYEEDERFYQSYYYARKDPEELKQFIKSFDPDELFRRKLIVREVEGSWNPVYMSEDMMNQEELNKEIATLKHNRYTPLFDHQHIFFEMVYVLEGSCSETIEGHNFQLTQGQFCIIPPHTTHSIGVFDDSIIINIIIWRKTFEDIFYNLLRHSNIIADFFNKSLYLYEQNGYMLVDTKHDETIRNLVLDMVGQNLEQKPFHDIVKNSQIMYILSLVLQNYEKDIQFPEKLFDGNDIMIKMISYIEHHYKDVTLETLAEAFNFSSSYCSRMIKKYTGKAFTEIVLNIKFTKAKSMLEMDDRSIAEIAESTGFNNIEHFNRLFKKRFDMTPGVYRKISRKRFLNG